MFMDPEYKPRFRAVACAQRHRKHREHYRASSRLGAVSHQMLQNRVAIHRDADLRSALSSDAVGGGYIIKAIAPRQCWKVAQANYLVQVMVILMNHARLIGFAKKGHDNPAMGIPLFKKKARAGNHDPMMCGPNLKRRQIPALD